MPYSINDDSYDLEVEEGVFATDNGDELHITLANGEDRFYLVDKQGRRRLTPEEAARWYYDEILPFALGDLIVLKSPPAL